MNYGSTATIMSQLNPLCITASSLFYFNAIMIFTLGQPNQEE
jgi:hypothetical protein